MGWVLATALVVASGWAQERPAVEQDETIAAEEQVVEQERLKKKKGKPTPTATPQPLAPAPETPVTDCDEPDADACRP